MDFDLATLDALTLDPATNAPTIKASQPVTSDEDVEPYGDLPVAWCLGVTAAPYPPTKEGFCEGFVVKNVGGHDAIIAGARDTRSAAIVGNLKPGDTVIYSTGPQQAAQLQLKEDKRQCALVTKDSDGKTVLMGLDGKNDQVQIITPWGYLEISKANGVMILDGNGAGLQLKDGFFSAIGTVVLGGTTPLYPVIGGLSAPGAPVPGIFVGGP